ncbi:hypothetical protein, partial [Rhizobium sp. L18]|uniref:hypothetical protein n=1 Tax=Rhizobium sp. L18 TaxID=2035451 RepID=UPI001AECF526
MRVKRKQIKKTIADPLHHRHAERSGRNQKRPQVGGGTLHPKPQGLAVLQRALQLHLLRELGTMT